MFQTNSFPPLLRFWHSELTPRWEAHLHRHEPPGCGRCDISIRFSSVSLFKMNPFGRYIQFSDSPMCEYTPTSMFGWLFYWRWFIMFDLTNYYKILKNLKHRFHSSWQFNQPPWALFGAQGAPGRQWWLLSGSPKWSETPRDKTDFLHPMWNYMKLIEITWIDNLYETTFRLLSGTAVIVVGCAAA